MRVQLTRDQEHGWDFYGPATLVDIRGAVDADGKIAAYDYVSYQQAWVFVGGDRATLAARPLPLGGFGGADIENAGSQYKIANHRVLGRSIPNDSQLPKVAYLRAPAAPQALFASEQMIDELAVRGRAWTRSPSGSRTSRTSGGSAVLEEAARLAGWDAASPARADGGKGRIRKGRGIAIGGFASTFAGIVAEIEVDTVTGKIRAKHVYAAHDCGLIINPNMVGQQVEGLRRPGRQPRADRGGQVLEEPRHLAGLGVVSDPPVQGRAGDHDMLLNRPELRSSGAGEPATAPVAAAIANAFFDATGKRIRTMPMTPARVRAVLKA